MPRNYRVTAHLDDESERGYLTEQRGGGFSWKWYEGRRKPRLRTRAGAERLRDLANRWLTANGCTPNARLVHCKSSEQAAMKGTH